MIKLYGWKVFLYKCVIRKRANIRNRYNQAPQLTQDTNGKVTTSQLDITNESPEGSPFPTGLHFPGYVLGTDLNLMILLQQFSII